VIGRFATSTAYRQALEARLLAAHGSERVQRGRKRLVTERLVVRLQDQQPSGFLVKGGFALELRLAGDSRTTRDLDVAAAGEVGSGADAVADEIEAACRIDARDGFEMRSARAPEEIAATQKAKTFRFTIEAWLDGRRFEPISLDVRVGDFVPLTFDLLPGSDLLHELIDLAPPRFRVVPLEYHFAEKVHAFTRRRAAQPTRVRDLVDMLLLIDLGTPSNETAWRALEEVFSSAEDSPPEELLPPPRNWAEDFSSLAKPLRRIPTGLDRAFEIVSDFYQKIER
jgi:predicted nucleotidyltransferase component of viral defense system